MRAYHFLNAKYGLEGVANRRIRISRLLELNDPFEFIGVELSDRPFRRAVKETKTELSKSNGILCFSSTWKNPVLWSHYADRHRGVCLGFDIPRGILEPVSYVDTRVTQPQVLDEAFMKCLLFTKFVHWAYEQEYRAYVSLTEEVDGHYFMKFSKGLKLRQVIVGAESKVTRAELAEALGALRTRVEVFKARAAFTTFNMVRNKNQSLWA